MKDKIVCTKELKIPFCRIIYDPKCEPEIEIKNHHTKKTESMPISAFVSLLLYEAYHPPVEKE